MIKKKAQKKSQSKPKLPRTLYSHWFDGDGVENRFLQTEQDPKELRGDDGDKDMVIRAGVYELVGVIEIEYKTTTKTGPLKKGE